jgi:hypothetical protein
VNAKAAWGLMQLYRKIHSTSSDDFQTRAGVDHVKAWFFLQISVGYISYQLLTEILYQLINNDNELISSSVVTLMQIP